MTIPITLSNIGSIPQNPTSAETTINSNSAAINTAFNSALSTSGDQMQGNLDMNSNRILNLPLPVSNLEPARLADIEVLTGGGTITINPLPTGGTTGQFLSKNSNTNYDAGWSTPTNVVPTGGTANQVLTKNSGTNFDSSWANLPASGTITGVTAGTGLTGGGTTGGVTLALRYNSATLANITAHNPTGTTSTSAVFMGLGNDFSITPATSGRVKVDITGVGNAPSGFVITLQGRFGTGSFPTNGTSVGGTGSPCSGTLTWAGTGSNTLSSAFCLSGVLTGLTVGTPYWFDISLTSSNASANMSVNNVTANAFEF